MLETQPKDDRRIIVAFSDGHDIGSISPNAAISDAHEDVTDYIRTKNFTPNTMLALRTLVSDIGNETALYKEMKNIPNDRVRNFRNDMYLISEAIRLMQKSGNPAFVRRHRHPRQLQEAHRSLHPIHTSLVKVAVAFMALGLGTMVGWKRIVVTVGEKIGKSHLTYAQGAVAEITAMATIGPPTDSVSPSAPLTCSPPASPAPWPRTTPEFSGPRCGIWPWPGFSPCP